MGALGFAASGGLFPQSGFDIGWSIGPFDFGLGSVFGQPWNLPVFGGLPSGLPDWSIISEIPQYPTAPPAPPPPPEEEVDVAHDWGHILAGTLGNIATGIFAPTPSFPQPFVSSTVPPPFTPTTVVTPPSPAFTGVVERMGTECGLDGQTWGGQAPPKGYKVVNYCGVATLRKIRRRRRRRMLSVSDKNDIASIVSMVGKGQMASALINRTSP